MSQRTVLKEGYYISTFLCVGELQNVLDIKIRHDHAIALWRYWNEEIRLIRYWEIERLSGIKQHAKALYDKRAFYELLSILLAEEKLDISDIIEIWGTKDVESNRLYMKGFPSTVAFHSIAHLLTAICYDNKAPMDSCIVGLALDAGPDSMFEEYAYDKYYYSGCVIKKGKLDFFTVESPARLWSYARKKFGMQEGALMALANAISRPFFVDNNLISFWCEYEFFGKESSTNAQIIVDSISEYIFSLCKNGKLSLDNRFSSEENCLSAIIEIVSEVSKRIVFRNIDRIIREYNINPAETTIALAGGFALNCPTNTAILSKYGFEGYQIPPCASDTGIALGVGIAAFWGLIKNKKASVVFDSAYYGQGVGNIQYVIEKYDDYIVDVHSCNMNEISELLINGDIIAWINGNAEIGPRALGNRSLLADPRTTKSKDKLNEIKKRQWWRPVAPVIMDQYGEDFFYDYVSSPNMLLNLYVVKEKQELIPAVVHYDGSARIQSVSLRSNPILYALIESFYKKTNIPILCNTSLNDKGEPIVNRIEEAINFCLHNGLTSICVNGNTLITLKKCNDMYALAPKLRNTDLFFSKCDNKAIERALNPYNLSVKELTFYYDNLGHFKNFNIEVEDNAKKIQMQTKKYLNDNRFGLDR